LSLPSRRLGKDEHAASQEGNSESEGNSISITQILSLKERFDAADTDGGGSLDLREFMDAFGSIINKDGSMTGLVFFVRMLTLHAKPPCSLQLQVLGSNVPFSAATCLT